MAVVSELQCLTYRQLHERSNAIARRLQAQGVAPGRPVAISLERTAQLPEVRDGALAMGLDESFESAVLILIAGELLLRVSAHVSLMEWSAFFGYLFLDKWKCYWKKG
jgi:acyl-CoA synthetase (AMP-forming)/AMP-acid ligase II